MAGRIITFVYGVTCYLLFLGVFMYLAGFLANVGVPKGIDDGATTAVGVALLVNIGLVALFGLQHSVMARPTFKRWWTRIVPRPAERSTYVLSTNVVLVMLYVLWQPMDATIWDFESPAVRAAFWTVYAIGWLIVFVSTLLINHFDLFGLRQVWLHLLGREDQPVGFVTPGPYKHIRHPLYVGWMIAFWATPTMSAGHLIFAAGMSAYILIAIGFEERNLAQFHGQRYLEWRNRTPMFVPRRRRRAPAGTSPVDTMA